MMAVRAGVALLYANVTRPGPSSVCSLGPAETESVPPSAPLRAQQSAAHARARAHTHTHRPAVLRFVGGKGLPTLV